MTTRIHLNNLSHAGADLHGADLGSADLLGADLRGADLGNWERDPDTGRARRKTVA